MQLSLTEWQPPQAKATAPEQARQAARVGKGIDEAVLEIARRAAKACAECPGPVSLEAFTGSVQRLLAQSGKRCAPDSPRRRLSALVKEGIIDAECVDRSRSLWVVRSVRP